MLEAYDRQPFAHLVADAGYDQERNHGLVRLRLGATSTIRPRRPPPGSRQVHGEFRQQMHQQFDRALYGQRWQIESAFSQCKRRLGSALTARTWWTLQRETELRVLTHNLMIT